MVLRGWDQRPRPHNRGGALQGRWATTLGAGRPLDPAPAARLGGAFGHSFARVRIHDDADGAALAASQRAAAVAVGDSIAFASGAYAPGSVTGDLLLAHELAHVAQQDGATDAVEGDRAAEDAADRAAVAAIARPDTRSAAREIGPPRGFALRRCDATPEELKAYEQELDRTGKPNRGFTDDDKARQIAREWAHRSQNVPGAELTPRRKVLLIRELLDGDVGGDDQEAILELLERSQPGELEMLFSGPNGLTIDEIRKEMGGGRRTRFDDFVHQRVLDEGKRDEHGATAVTDVPGVDVGDPLPGGGERRGGTGLRTSAPSDAEVDGWIAEEYRGAILSSDNAKGTLATSLDVWEKHTTHFKSKGVAEAGSPEEAKADYIRRCVDAKYGEVRGADYDRAVANCTKEVEVSRGLYLRWDPDKVEGRSLIAGDAPARTHVHEALHAYTHPAFLKGAPGLSEGATEYFAHRIIVKHKLSLHGPSYEAQRVVIEELVILLGDDQTLQHAYFGGRLDLLKAAVDARLGEGVFDRVIAADTPAAIAMLSGTR